MINLLFNYKFLGNFYSYVFIFYYIIRMLLNYKEFLRILYIYLYIIIIIP